MVVPMMQVWEMRMTVGNRPMLMPVGMRFAAVPVEVVLVLVVLVVAMAVFVLLRPSPRSANHSCESFVESTQPCESVGLVPCQPTAHLYRISQRAMHRGTCRRSPAACCGRFWTGRVSSRSGLRQWRPAPHRFSREGDYGKASSSRSKSMKPTKNMAEINGVSGCSCASTSSSSVTR